MIKALAIFGAGGHAKVVLDIVRSSNQIQEVEIFDDAYTTESSFKLLNLPTIGNANDLCSKQTPFPFVVAIGNNHIRANKQNFFMQHQLIPAPALIHPRATISQFSAIEDGAVVMAGAVINPGVKIAAGVIINTSAVIDHDCQINAFAHIAPNATLCGNVHVGEFSWVGAGATIIEGIKIGKNCMIGAGAVVVKDVPDNVQVVGVPARQTKEI